MATVATLPNASAEGALASPAAEAALLGALLIDNSTFARIGGLRAEHFAEGLHQRIFRRIADTIERGEAVTAATIRPYFEADPDMQAIGGAVYLARLTADDSGLLAPREHARQIVDFAERRARIAYAREVYASASDLAQPLGEIDPPRLENATGLAPLDLAALANVEPPLRQFVIPQIAPAGEVTLLTGAGAGGKSLLGQQLCSALAIGRATLGLTFRAAPAIYLTAEDSPDELHRRQRHICEALDVPMTDMAGLLFLISRRGEPDNFLAAPDAQGAWRPGPLYRAIERLIVRTGAQAVFLDNVAHLFPGDENIRADVTGFVNCLNRLAGETGAAVILIGHPNKAGDRYSGSTAWLNAVRSQVTFERPKDAEHDPDARALVLGKANYARGGEVLRCRWHNWAYVRDEDLPADQREQIGETIAVSSANEAFLACLRARAEQGDARAVGPRPGPNFAPAQFEQMPQAKGHDRTALRRAMERLLTIGLIECHTVENRAKGRTLTVLREVPQGSPNAFPNSSRTLFPNDPEPRPNMPQSLPEHTLPPMGGGEGGPSGASPSPLDERNPA